MNCGVGGSAIVGRATVYGTVARRIFMRGFANLFRRESRTASARSFVEVFQRELSWGQSLYRTLTNASSLSGPFI